jgi:predicted RNA methylase
MKSTHSIVSILLLGTIILVFQVDSIVSFSVPAPVISGVKLQKVHLRNNKESESPFCYAATVDPTLPPPEVKFNFLASQVWPSARSASFICEQKVDLQWTVCELGCGPALPSLVMASMGVKSIIATDICEFGLQMAEKAAEDQGLVNFCTRKFDLVDDDFSILNEVEADLFVMSDVFETGKVAKGAAKFTMKALESGSRVWVFAQSDRAQREVYRDELQKLCGNENEFSNHLLEWKTLKDTEEVFTVDDDLLWLCNIDEISVNYG